MTSLNHSADRERLAGRTRFLALASVGALLCAGSTPACSSETTTNGSGGNSAQGGALVSGGVSSAVTGGVSSAGSNNGTGGLPTAQGGATISSGGALSSGGTVASSGGTIAAGSGGEVASGGDGGHSGGSSGGQANSGGVGGASVSSGGSGGKSNGGTGGAGGSTQPTVWIAGDSTVANGSAPCPIGWGAQFKNYFNDSVKVVNSAVGGRSVRTWLYNVTTAMDSSGECVLQTDASGKPTLQARWQNMLNGMKAGDYLFIQFGINDGSATCDRHVGIKAFKDSYAMMAAAAKERGAQPVFLTPASAVACNGSTAGPSRGDFVSATLEVGKQNDAPVIDLHALTIALYNARGFCPIAGGDVSASTTGPVGEFFCDDHTHFSPSGAVAVAELVAKAVRDQRLGLSTFLK